MPAAGEAGTKINKLTGWGAAGLGLFSFMHSINPLNNTFGV
jgi:hypothetical protein